MRVLGMDIGFGRCKGALDGRTVEFPAFVSAPSALDLGEVHIRNVLTDPEGHVWIYGEDAILEGGARITLAPDKMRSETDRARMLALLGELFADSPMGYIDRIVTGLPVAELGPFKDDVVALLKGPHKFSIGKRNYNITIGDVRVIPQGAGAYYSLVLQDGKESSEASSYSGRCLIVDVGYRTVNLVTLDNGRYVPHLSATLPKDGINNLHLDLRRLIARQFSGYDVGIAEIDKACRTRSVLIDGEVTRIGDLVEAAALSLGERVVEQIETYSDSRSVAKVILTGGGSALLQPVFAPLFKNLVVPPQASLANAVGYLEYGKWIARRETPSSSSEAAAAATSEE
ncbi:MAG: ParM/StbA family protein [Thermaerobacter sp.]|nr:ParM/StbA family protein [Thermaerobacter sp.]